MRTDHPGQRLRPIILIGAALLMVVLAGAGSPARANPPLAGSGLLSGVMTATTDFGPGINGRVHRTMTRAERSLYRLVGMAGQVGRVWGWLLVSAGAFLLLSAFSSVADLRMFDLRREGPGVLSRYVGYGMRTFFRILRDRHTPNLARLVLALALIYWLIPTDLIADDSLLPGFLDDLVVLIVAAKAFMYLCPDSLVARHVAAVEGPAGVTP
jgi:uncharacterized protein DUF1232